MNNLWCTNYSSVRTKTRFTVLFFFFKVAVNDISVMSGLLPVWGERKEERDRLKGHNPPPKFASSEAKGYVH